MVSGRNARNGHQNAFCAVIAAVIASGLLIAAFAAGVATKSALDLHDVNDPAIASNSVEVAVDCEGWSERNVALGVFVTGWGAGGVRLEEQLIFDGAGTQSLEVPAGGFEAIAQMPQIMLADGSIVSSSEVVPIWCDPGQSDDHSVQITYVPMSLYGLTDDELASLANESFMNEADASEALDLARVLRDAAPEPSEATDEDQVGE